jgi:dipeptidase E
LNHKEHRENKTRIVAVGGGDTGEGGKRPEVTPISREIIRLSGKKHPKLLFLPTALSDDSNYVKAIDKHFGKKLGCRVRNLYLIKRKPGIGEIKYEILKSDIIYVGGGNTLMMVNRWKRLGVDKVLKEARRRGKVLCGVSAGAICWFRQGNSDSRKFKNPKAKLIKVTGLGFINALACPHYDVDRDRKPQLKTMIKKTPGVAIAIDNCAALEVVGNRCRAIVSKPKAGVYRVFWGKGKYIREKVAREWQPLETLLRK